MGKIFDALEKSKGKDADSISIKQPSKNAVNKRPEIQDSCYSGPEIFYDSSKIDKNLITLLEPQSFEAEQFRMLRTNLLFPVSGEPPRSIMVTSAVPSEGKSFVAANLAISIAQSIQEHVLLIDCDIRLPSIHKQFGFGDVPGLSECLSNGTPLSSFILKTKVDKLNIVPGGKSPHNPSELLSSQQMSRLLKETRDRYRDRYIVIDSPPVDGIILVVEYGATPRQMVSDLIEKMGKEKILGIILNKLDIRFSSYYGMGKYSKYGKYYGT
ncbi:MAG: polysaccharide biosynthesis tyrosine autokinase [Deltaproteobacteria bacterium]|nr:polysaccharide biosynthesis tyrosine autokinase [Deltaproteobacteria bacterium]